MVKFDRWMEKKEEGREREAETDHVSSANQRPPCKQILFWKTAEKEKKKANVEMEQEKSARKPPFRKQRALTHAHT